MTDPFDELLEDDLEDDLDDGRYDDDEEEEELLGFLAGDFAADADFFGFLGF